MTRIAACICTHDRYDRLPQAINSLRRQTLAREDFEIIVVDNSSNTGAARSFGARFVDERNLRYLVEASPGLSRARNVATAMCDADFIAFLDDDAVADSRWLAGLLEGFAAFDRTDVVGGPVYPDWQAPRPSWLHYKAFGYLSLVVWGGALREALPQEWFAGTNIAFRVAALRQAGGFAAHLGRVGAESLLGHEETDARRRVVAGGGKAVYQPAAIVHHRIDRDRLTRDWFRRRVAWQAVSDGLLEGSLDADSLKAAEPRIQGLMRSLAATERDAPGSDDPAAFHDELRAIYLRSAMLLGTLRRADATAPSR